MVKALSSCEKLYFGKKIKKNSLHCQNYSLINLFHFQLAQMNPYAAMCNQMLRQMFDKLQSPSELI